MKSKLNKGKRESKGKETAKERKKEEWKVEKKESGKRLGSKMCSDRLVSSFCKYHFQNKVVRKRGQHAKPKMLTLKEGVKHTQK